MTEALPCEIIILIMRINEEVNAVSKERTDKRMIHYELLRILAAFSVVMLHSAAQFWYSLDVNSTEWVIANSYNALFRFGVPVFVMISGALFLDENYQLDLKRLYKHNILRLVIIYAVWSCLYGLLDCYFLGFETLDIKTVLREMINGRYHLWFLPMIVGIYMLLPILKSWLAHAEKRNVQYFLLLFIVLQVGGETIRALTVTDEIHTLLDLIDVQMVCSYLGYFVWGYYLAHVGIGESCKKLVYGCVLPALLCNILLSNYLLQKYNRQIGVIYDSYGVFTFIEVTALFVFGISKWQDISLKSGVQKAVYEVSAGTFGVYVMHIGLMELTERIGIHSMMLANIAGIPLYAIGCFAVCLLVAMLVRRIPIIGKYIC